MNSMEQLDHDLDLSFYTYEKTIQDRSKKDVALPTLPTVQAAPSTATMATPSTTTIQKKTIINVDSTSRTQTSVNVLEDNTYRLTNNPVRTTKGSSTVKLFSSERLKLQEGDRIVVDNVMGQQYRVMKVVEFIPNSQYIRINLSHQYMTNFDYNTPQYVLIDLVDDVSAMTNYGNVPWSIVEGKHRIYLTSFEGERSSFDYFYIYLKTVFVPTDETTSQNNIYQGTVDLNIEFVNGIPTKAINANYPLVNRLNGNHIVQSITNDSSVTIVEIDCAIPATRDGVGGGDDVRITRISKTIPAHPSPSQYSVDLARTFHNVTKIEIVGSEIPNCTKLLYSSPDEKENNHFYWQVLKDGPFVYQASFQQGYYTPESLVEEFHKKVSSVERTSTTSSGTMNDIVINIDVLTNTVELKAFETITLAQPFTFQQSFQSNESTAITIKHPNHNLDVGDTIEIQKCNEVNGVPKDVLERHHIVTEITNVDSYVIALPQYEAVLPATTSNTFLVEIRYPIEFRVLCKSTSLMSILGFNAVGDDRAITVFSKEITNLTPYIYEDVLDVANEEYGPLVSNQIPTPIFVTQDYILMECNNIANLYNNAFTNAYFTKFRLTEPPGHVVVDGHIEHYVDFETPIPSLNSLYITFYHPDGTMYSFNNRNHSIVFVITEQVTRPDL